MRLVVVSFVVLFATACDPSPEQAKRDVCTVACQCETNGLPSQVESCVEACVPQVPVVSDECLECFYTYSQSCSDLERECEDACDQPQPQP